MIPEQENQKINPLMKSAAPIKKSVDQYAQSIAVLSIQAAMALGTSTKVVKESHEIVDKITYLLPALSQPESAAIVSTISSLKTVIEQSYQAIEPLKKEVDTVAKEQSSQDVLSHLNSLVPKIQNEKTTILEAKETLSKVLDKLFELPKLTINSQQESKLFANQIYVAADEVKGKIVEAQKYSNDLNSQLSKYNLEARLIKKEFNLLWKDKETSLSDIADKIKSLALLKNEKIISLQQKIINNSDPLWSNAVDQQTAFIEKLDGKLQETVEGAVVQALTHLKNESERQFKDLVNLHQEYQSKMPNKLSRKINCKNIAIRAQQAVNFCIDSLFTPGYQAAPMILSLFPNYLNQIKLWTISGKIKKYHIVLHEPPFQCLLLNAMMNTGII